MKQVALHSFSFLHFFVLGLILLLTSSCTTRRGKKMDEWKSGHGLSSGEATNIEGEFLNASGYAEYPFGGPRLWTILTARDSGWHQTIRFTKVSPGKYHGTLLYEGKVEDEEEFRVKVMKDHIELSTVPFDVSTGGETIPIPGIWVYSENLVAMKVDGRGGLSIYKSSGGLMFLGPIPLFGAEGTNTLVFRRVGEGASGSSE